MTVGNCFWREGADGVVGPDRRGAGGSSWIFGIRIGWILVTTGGLSNPPKFGGAPLSDWLSPPFSSAPGSSQWNDVSAE